jgi:hypothetical protein
MAAWRATAPTTLGEPASSRSGGSVHTTSSRSTSSTAPPPARNGSPSVNVARGTDQDPGAEGRVHLVATPGEIVGVGRQWPVGGELGGVDQHWDRSGVGGGDDGVQRWRPAGYVRRPRDGQQPGPATGVEDGNCIIDAERPVRSAFDESALAEPGPRQEVGVVLDDGGDDDVVATEAELVGEVVDGFGGVPTHDGDVVAVGGATGERQCRAPCVLEGVCGEPGFVAGAAVHARVPGEELSSGVAIRRWAARRPVSHTAAMTPRAIISP